MITRRALIRLSTASAFAAGVGGRAADAQTWPTRPIRFLVPFAAGGPTDAIARIVGERLSKIWDQQVVIENKGGAGGNLAFEAAARSEADGYTMVMGGSTLAANRSLYRTLSYDAVADFAPVSAICNFSYFMFVSNAVPAQSVKEFIAYAKENKDKLTMASPGTGSAPHLCGEYFKRVAGIEMAHAPYRGAGPAMGDLMPGRVHLLFSGGATLENARAGQVRVLGYTGSKRAAMAPDVPTIAEAGLPGFEVASWYGLFVPARTPDHTTRTMNATAVTALTDPSVVGRLDQLGYTAAASTREELAAHLKADIDKWSRVINEAGIAI